MAISTIVFDAYGTLIDTADGSVRATREILRRRGSRLDATEVYARWKRHNRELEATSPAFQLEEVIFAEGLRRVYGEYQINGDPGDDVGVMLATLGVRNAFADARPCVEWCRERFHVVIASNTDTAPFEKELRRNALAVDRWFTSESLRAYKPQRDFYERMLQGLGRVPGEVVFVGDSIDADVIGPMACGMWAIWLNRKDASRPDIANLIEIRELGQIAEALATLQGNAE